MTPTLWIVAGTVFGIAAVIIIPNLVVWRRRRRD